MQIGSNYLVVVLDATDDDGAASLQEKTTSVPLENIISFAVWNRNGRSAVARRRRAEKDTWLNWVDSASSPFTFTVGVLGTYSDP